MSNPSAPYSQAADDGVILAMAVGHAAKLLGITGDTLAQIIGTSEATASAVLSGNGCLSPNTKEGELGALLVRLHLSLEALVGDEDDKRLAWLNSHCRALNEVPRHAILKVEGLGAVVAYLDGMRALI